MNEHDPFLRDALIMPARPPAGHPVGAGPATGKPAAFPVFDEHALRDFERSSSPMRIFDLETLKYVAANDAAVRFYGYSREEFLGITVRDTRDPEDQQALDTALTVQSGYLRHRPAHRHLTKSGEVAVEEVTQDILFNGRKSRLALTIDITGRDRALALLFQREQEFIALVENSPDIVSRLDRGFRHLYVNSAIVPATGRRPEEFVGRTIAEVGMPADLVARWDAALQDVFTNGRERIVESVHHGPRGARIYESRIVPERNVGGNVETVLVITRDFTEKKQAEEELQRQKNLLATIIDNLPVGVFIRDAKSLRYVMRNRFLERLSGLPAESSVGKAAHDLFPKAQADLSVATDRKALDSGQMVEVLEQEMLGRSGEQRIFHVRKVPLPGDDGRPRLLVGIADDITDWKRAEMELRQTQQHLQVAVRGGGVGLWDWDVKAGTVYFSPEWKQQLGYEDRELPSCFEEWQSRLHPDDRDRLSTQLKDFLSRPNPDYRAEYRLRHRDGSYRWILSRAAAQLGEGGEVERMFGCHVDITEQKQAETERLANALRQRDALVREVHHRIKNSLQGVAGLLRQKVKKHPELAPAMEEALAQLQSVALVYGLQGRRADGMLSLAEILEAVCFSTEGLTGGRVDMTIERGSPRPACVAGSEAVSLAVALNELVFNAMKHQRAETDGRRTRVKLRGTESAAEICISNRGDLPADFDFPRGRAVGNGLELVRILMASPGGSIAFNGGSGKVEVVLKLRPPLLAERQDARAG